MKEIELLEFVDSIKICEIKPGDIVVLQCNQKLSPESFLRLKNLIKETFDKAGIKAEIMILDQSIKIGVMREE